MDNIFCTLFNSNYLDKGLVLYNSMRKVMNEFKLYVFAFDDKCAEILRNENLENLIVVELSEFETERLLKVKQERTETEYCWTCTPWIIKYVFEEYNEPICTYIDADMMFFSSPDLTFKRMRNDNNSIIIVPHRFNSKEQEKEEGEKTGYYCVEFNTFINNEDGTNALNWWAEKCIEWCHYTIPGVDKWYGDQKYLNVFPKKFKGVMICEDIGVGLGPWNDRNIKLVDESQCIISNSDMETTLIIYHYAGVQFITNNLLKVSSRMQDRKLHQLVFDDYVNQIVEARQYILRKYNFRITKKKSLPTVNPIMKFYQRVIMPIRHMKNIQNIYRVEDC